VSESRNSLAVDLGASNGRVIAADWNGTRFLLNEVYRFPNGGKREGLHLCWDVRELWAQIQSGISKFVSETGRQPAGIGVEAWGVDYGLLDCRGDLLTDPVHYRDQRTNTIVELMRPRLSEFEMFKETGVQTMAINTAYQLASVVLSGNRELDRAEFLLMIPDLFQYFLCGEKCTEYTEATTTQIFDSRSRSWVRKIFENFGIPEQIFSTVCLPSTSLGKMSPAVTAVCGLSECPPCVAVASHDTASAVAAIPNIDSNSVFISSGTWSLMGILSDRPVISEMAFQLGFTNEGAADGGILLLKNLCGLWILQECKRCWDASEGIKKWEEIAAAAKSAPAFRSLIYPSAPDFQAPGCMLDAIREYCLRSEQPAPQTLGQFARCVLESLALQYRRTVEEQRALSGRPLSSIRIVGGGSRNRLLCQMTADACKMVVFAGPVESAALGNALLQAISTNHLRGFHEGSTAVANSVKTTHYRPKQDDRWESALFRVSLISDQIRDARIQSKYSLNNRKAEVGYL
jgi:rhamnulokinase